MDAELYRFAFFLGLGCGGLLGSIFTALIVASLCERSAERRISRALGRMASQHVIAQQDFERRLADCRREQFRRPVHIDMDRINRSLERAAEATGVFRRPMLSPDATPKK